MKRQFFGTFVICILCISPLVAQGQVEFTSTGSFTIETTGFTDGYVSATDVAYIELAGPNEILRDDGARQIFNIDLSALDVTLAPGARHYGFSLFLPDATFPLSGTPGPDRFFPPDSLDRLKVFGDNLSDQGLQASLQEYNRNYPFGPASTKLAFFSDWHTDAILKNSDEIANLTSLEYTLDIPDLFNTPSFSLDRAVLRIRVNQRFDDINSAAGRLPGVEVVVPEPAAFLTAALLVSILMMSRERVSRP